MNIRPACLEDQEQLTECWNKLEQSLPDSPLNSDLLAKQTFHQQLAQQVISSDQALALVTDNNSKITACICGHIYQNPQLKLTPIGVIYNLWVEPEYRRQGIATALVNALEVQLRQLGANAIQLAWRNDVRAAQFWQKQGYAQVETIAAKI